MTNPISSIKEQARKQRAHYMVFGNGKAWNLLV